MNRLTICIALCLATIAQSCQKTDSLQEQINSLRDRIELIERSLGQINTNIETLHKFFSEAVVVVGVTKGENGDYTIEFSDGSSAKIIAGELHPALVPIMSIDTQGYWIFSTDGTKFERLLDANGNPISARSSDGTAPQLKVDKDGFWMISYDGTTYTQLMQNGKPVSAEGAKQSLSLFKSVSYNPTTGMLSMELLDGTKLAVPVRSSFSMSIVTKGRESFLLSESRQFEIVTAGVDAITIDKPKGWQAEIADQTLTISAPARADVGYDSEFKFTIVSKEGYLRVVSLPVSLKAESIESNATKAWSDFVADNAQNQLVDYSYAGYKRGEVAPPDVYSLAHEIINVQNFGAIANDGKSDRVAFEAAVARAVEVAKSKLAIIYLPNGRYDLRESAAVDGVQTEILIRSSNIILKGESREGTVVVMNAHNTPPAGSDNPPTLISMKNWSGMAALTDVTADARRGSFTVDVADPSRLTSNMWICLTLSNNSRELIDQELAPMKFVSTMTNLTDPTDPADPTKGGGLKVLEYHQIKSVNGNKVTFHEPLMHAVESRWGWKLFNFNNHYENVGVEDLTFEGNCVGAFSHHGDDGVNPGWLNDSGYKLLSLMRLTNSWVRRVTFRNVSEALTFANSANCSAYDIKVEGRRGHSAVRAQGSSRIFIGQVSDVADLTDAAGNVTQAGAGQWHTSGVSQTSIGTVLWQLNWGAGSCFEAHASQPRHTLVDNCTGGMIAGRMGGATAALPNHLEGLTLWNFNAKSAPSSIVWWSPSDSWIKCMPPIIVGYHGSATQFAADQTALSESHGTRVNPESLYEAQLRRRLGYIPGWLNSLK